MYKTIDVSVVVPVFGSTGALDELDERRLTELIVAMPLQEISEFDLRVSHQPRAGGKMPVGHDYEDNYVADNDRRGRGGAPGETSMSLALRRRDDRWDSGAVVLPGQLSCDTCGRVFTMNGLWLVCFCCPSVFCCNSCKYRHEALTCWVVADSGKYTADEYMNGTLAFARPCSVHRDRTDLSDQMKYHRCMHGGSMVPP